MTWRIEGLGISGEDMYLTNGRARLSLYAGEVEDPELRDLSDQLQRGTFDSSCSIKSNGVASCGCVIKDGVVTEWCDNEPT